MLRTVFAMYVFAMGISAFADDRLIIISPHRKSIQDEFVPDFESYYLRKFGTKVSVEWIDQGGTSDDLRFVKSKFAKNPQSAGVDLFWGGGATTFIELNAQGFTQKYDLPANLKAAIPDAVVGVPFTDKNHTWYATACSSFGIFFNRRLLQMEKLTEPKKIADLLDPKFRNKVALTDPRRSGTATVMNEIIIQTRGWDNGWRDLVALGANTKQFSHSSSDPIKSVTSGDTVATLAIDFYALAKIADLGEKNLGFVLPEGQTVLDPDPIAILKGAPNRKVAERFIDYSLSVDAQKILMLPKGAPGGPKLSYLGRMAVNREVYAELAKAKIPLLVPNPFEMKTSAKIDLTNSAGTFEIFNDLIGATIIDTHKDLKAAWTAITSKGAADKFLAELATPPLSKDEFEKLAKRWKDDKFRNEKINEWVKFAREKYQRIEKKVLAH